MGSLLLLVGCRVERPKEILSPSQMEEVLYDFHLAQVMGSDLNGEEAYKRSLYLEYVYEKHHITGAQLDSSLVWYARYPKNLATIYDRLAKRADAEMEMVRQKQIDAESRGPKPVEGDSADVWYDRRLVMLASSPLSNRASYVIPTDTNFHLCDTLVWTFDIRFFPRNRVWEDTFEELTLLLADSLATDSLTMDSLFVDSLRKDSVHTRTLSTDSLKKDSLSDALLALDSLRDNMSHVDSLRTDSLQTDTLTAAGRPTCRAKVIASLVLHYDDDTTVALDRVVEDDGHVCITLQNPDSVRMSEVYVSVYFKSHETTDRVVLYNNCLTRYHTIVPRSSTISDELTPMSDEMTTDSLSGDSVRHKQRHSAFKRHRRKANRKEQTPLDSLPNLTTVDEEAR